MLLRSDHPNALCSVVAYADVAWDAWRGLPDAVAASDGDASAFERAHGADVWTWLERDERRGALYNAATGAMSSLGERLICGRR